MADKQATVYIVDVGLSTGDCHNGRVESDLDYGMRYVWAKITETMSANRAASWSVGAVGLRTVETNNIMGSEDGYENIAVLKPLGPMEMPHLNDLQSKIKSSETDSGDAISAIVVAIDLIEKFTTLKSGKPGKFTRKIVLLTDGQGAIDGEDIEPIVQRINELEIELVVM
jgi:ATP-dependent DNA helicase 2 subunit 2